MKFANLPKSAISLVKYSQSWIIGERHRGYLLKSLTLIVARGLAKPRPIVTHKSMVRSTLPALGRTL